MSSTKGSVVLMLLKWIAVPALLLVAGYFLVGPFVPRILGSAPISPVKQSAPAPQTQAPSEDASYGEPQVDVSARRTSAARRRSSSSSGHRHKSTNRVRVYKEPPKDKPAEDQQGAPPANEPPPTTGIG